MKHVLRTLVLALVVAAALPAAAQNLIFYQNTRSESYLAKYHGGGPAEGVIDHFIERLATGSNKTPSRTEFIIVHDENVRLTKVSQTQYDVLVTLGNIRLTGDTQYRGFAMQDHLLPTGVKFALERLSKAGQVLERIPFEEIPLEAGTTTVANFRANDTTGTMTDQTVRLVDKQFLYMKEAKGRFDARAILIDDYYASIPKLEALNGDLNRINPDDFEHIDAQQNDLAQLQTRLDNIASPNFPQNLALAQADPVGYVARFQQLQGRFADLNARINQTRGSIPERYYQRGLAFAQQSKWAEANNDFNQAVRLKPTLAPAQLELARLRYREGDLAATKARLLIVLRDCQPDEATRQGAQQLGNSIYLNHLTNADFAVKQKKYPDALRALAEARGMCTDLRFPCTQQLEDLSTQAHGGIFQSKVDSARISLQANRLEEAEQRAGEAVAYQKANPAYVKDPANALRVQADAQTRIYQRLLVNANSLADQGKLKEAEAEARKAIDYQAAHTAAIAQPIAATQALERVMGLQYKDLIARAKGLQAQQQHRDALTLLDEAVVIETRHAVAKDPALWSLVQASAKPVLLAESQRGQQLAKANKLGEARPVALAVKAMAEQYKLQGDAEVAKAVESVNGAIFSQECTNAQNDFEAGINDADVQVKLKKFIEADAAYDRALKVVADQAVCGIDGRRATEGKVRIATVVQYQRALLETQAAIDRNESKKAIDLYLGAGDLFISDNLAAKWGLSHTPLADYILGSGRIEFVRYGVTFFTDKKDYAPALDCLHKCVQMGVATGLVKDIQKRLGTELGLRDRQTEPGSDPKVKALEYGRGNSKLKTLMKAYTKARK